MIAEREIARIRKVLIDWIEKGLSKNGKTCQGLAEALQIGPWQVSRMLANKSGSRRQIWAHELVIIAIYLDEPVPLHLMMPLHLAELTQADLEARASRRSRSRRPRRIATK